VLKSGVNHWGSLAKFFHWAVVLLIIVQGAIGLIMVDLPKSPGVIPVFSLHKSLGLTILALATLRLAWRAFDPRPVEPPDIAHWQVLAARAGHAFLYVLLFAVPLTGWWFDSLSGLRPLYFFGLFEVPHLVAPDKALKELASQTHATLFWVLVAVAASHALIALVHQFKHRNNVLGRMWPAWLQRRPAITGDH
jgi:cytochrome b561